MPGQCQQIFRAERDALQRPAKTLPLQFIVHLLRPFDRRFRQRQGERVVAGPEFLQPLRKGPHQFLRLEFAFLEPRVELGDGGEENIVRHALNWNAGSVDIGISNWARTTESCLFDSSAALYKSASGAATGTCAISFAMTTDDATDAVAMTASSLRVSFSISLK